VILVPCLSSKTGARIQLFRNGICLGPQAKRFCRFHLSCVRERNCENILQ